MAEQRPIWRGHLRLALVSCPVALFTAHHAAAELRFHFINPKTGNRVRMVTLDAGNDKEVKRSDLVKGYEFKKDTYVLLNDDDFERAKIDSSNLMAIDKFVPAATIDPVYFDDSYYLVPDGDAGQDVFAVLREAIQKSGQVALSRVVIARRERAVAMMPMDRGPKGWGMVLHTLHEERDLYDPKSVLHGLPASKPDPAMVKLATQLIDSKIGKFDPADMEDRYEARLRDVIQAKLKGEEIAMPEDDEEESNVIDLMAALKRSLGQAAPHAKAARGAPKKAAAKAPRKAQTKASTKTPAKVAAKQPARKRA